MQGQHFLQYVYRGRAVGVRWTDPAKLHMDTVEERLEKLDQETVANIHKLHEQLDNFEKSKPVTNRYPEIVFLGTSGAIPSNYRNVSCYLVQTSPDSCMLLDCGESSIIQLLQFYGDEADTVLCKLKAIFISHVHLDHHGGTTGLITARNAALKRAGLPQTKLYVVGPYRLQKYFSRYSVVCVTAMGRPPFHLSFLLPLR